MSESSKGLAQDRAAARRLSASPEDLRLVARRCASDYDFATRNGDIELGLMDLPRS